VIRKVRKHRYYFNILYWSINKPFIVYASVLPDLVATLYLNKNQEITEAEKATQTRSAREEQIT